MAAAAAAAAAVVVVAVVVVVVVVRTEDLPLETVSHYVHIEPHI